MPVGFFRSLDNFFRFKTKFVVLGKYLKRTILVPEGFGAVFVVGVLALSFTT